MAPRRASSTLGCSGRCVSAGAFPWHYRSTSSAATAHRSSATPSPVDITASTAKRDDGYQRQRRPERGAVRKRSPAKTDDIGCGFYLTLKLFKIEHPSSRHREATRTGSTFPRPEGALALCRRVAGVVEGRRALVGRRGPRHAAATFRAPGPARPELYAAHGWPLTRSSSRSPSGGGHLQPDPGDVKLLFPAKLLDQATSSTRGVRGAVLEKGAGNSRFGWRGQKIFGDAELRALPRSCVGGLARTTSAPPARAPEPAGHAWRVPAGVRHDVIRGTASRSTRTTKKKRSSAITSSRTEQNSGADAVYGLGIPLMRLVHVFRKAHRGLRPRSASSSFMARSARPVDDPARACWYRASSYATFNAPPTGQLYTFSWITSTTWAWPAQSALQGAR
jgi:hypothetical protein